jgi:hypothetical protein
VKCLTSYDSFLIKINLFVIILNVKSGWIQQKRFHQLKCSAFIDIAPCSLFAHFLPASTLKMEAECVSET